MIMAVLMAAVNAGQHFVEGQASAPARAAKTLATARRPAPAAAAPGSAAPPGAADSALRQSAAVAGRSQQAVQVVVCLRPS
jgi:hypothetical protein